MRNMCEFTAMVWAIYKVFTIEEYRIKLVNPTKEVF
jgi:hypothetical protein